MIKENVIKKLFENNKLRILYGLMYKNNNGNSISGTETSKPLLPLSSNTPLNKDKILEEILNLKIFKKQTSLAASVYDFVFSSNNRKKNGKNKKIVINRFAIKNKNNKKNNNKNKKNNMFKKINDVERNDDFISEVVSYLRNLKIKSDGQKYVKSFCEYITTTNTKFNNYMIEINIKTKQNNKFLMQQQINFSFDDTPIQKEIIKIQTEIQTYIGNLNKIYQNTSNKRNYKNTNKKKYIFPYTDYIIAYFKILQQIIYVLLEKIQMSVESE